MASSASSVASLSCHSQASMAPLCSLMRSGLTTSSTAWILGKASRSRSLAPSMPWALRYLLR
uniref:Uncharacterized protein n=1 Tax=Arundo donax TaxID=35708 RepID=A0A0A9C335_ARUDO